MNTPVVKQSFLDLEPAAISQVIAAAGMPAYRGRQLLAWVYQRRAAAFSACSNIPAAERERLGERFVLRTMAVRGVETSALDGTSRYQFSTQDHRDIAAVYLPGSGRASVCISTQIGCPIGCRFCHSGTTKFRRNLTRGEILEQVLHIEQSVGRRITGVLLMGMGEPLLNYPSVAGALRALVAFDQFGLGRRHVIVSTVGIVPRIRQLAEENTGVRLALSLHAPDDELRRRLIPEAAVPFTVKEILEAGLYYSRKTNSRLTIEYIVVPELNDTPKAAGQFVRLLAKSARPKDAVQVNLIPCNETARGKWHAPSLERVQRFRNLLAAQEVLATIREPRGTDIGAACGQLGF